MLFPIFSLVQELRVSLEKQRAQSNQLCVALKHEQTAKDNLQKELQIEASRCEALLAQERSQLSELRRSLEAEKGRSLELAAALRHERLLTEQLSRRAQEAPAPRALLRKLKDEKSRVAELQARLEQAQRQLAAEVQKQREEIEREKEVRGAQASAVEPAQAREPGPGLPKEGESPARQQAGLEHSRARPAAREGRKDARRRAEARPGGADAETRPTRDKERLVSACRPSAPSSQPGGGRAAGWPDLGPLLGPAGAGVCPPPPPGDRSL